MPVTIVGATSWGTTLAIALGRHQPDVRLLVRTADEARLLGETRRNPRLLVDVALPTSVAVHADPEAACQGADAVILAVPSQSMRQNARHLRETLRRAALVISAAKGLEAESGKRMSAVLREELGDEAAERIGVLSGPNIAPEIARGLPATTVVAFQARSIAERARSLLVTPRLRVYSHTDVLGVEMCGALKNIIAIGAGIADGSGYGQNAKAAFITRGLAEITRLGLAVGAQPLTFSGLAGLGDLWTTCSSPYSRNRTLGETLARGGTVAEALASMQQVAEGVPTTAAAYAMARTLSIEMPIVIQAHRVLFEGLAVETALVELMLRDAKHEFDGFDLA